MMYIFSGATDLTNNYSNHNDNSVLTLNNSAFNHIRFIHSDANR